MKVRPERLARQCQTLMEILGEDYRGAFHLVCRKYQDDSILDQIEQNEHGQDITTELSIRDDEQLIFERIMLQDHILLLVIDQIVATTEAKLQKSEAWQELQERMDRILDMYNKTSLAINELAAQESTLGSKAKKVFFVQNRGKVLLHGVYKGAGNDR